MNIRWKLRKASKHVCPNAEKQKGKYLKIRKNITTLGIREDSIKNDIF